MIMLLQMAKLVADDIVDAFTRGFDQMRIEKDEAGGRTASPLLLHPYKPPLGQLTKPTDAGGYFIEPSSEYISSPVPVPRGDAFFDC